MTVALVAIVTMLLVVMHVAVLLMAMGIRILQRAAVAVMAVTVMAVAIVAVLRVAVVAVALVHRVIVTVRAVCGGPGPALAGDLADLEAVVASVVAWRLELQRDMTEVKALLRLLLQQAQHFHGICGTCEGAMSRQEGALAHVEGVKIIHRVHARRLLQRLLKLADVDVLGNGQQDRCDDAADGARCGEDDQDSEDEGANGICVDPLRETLPTRSGFCEPDIKGLPPNQESREYHTDTLHHVTDHVGDGRLHGDARLGLVAVVVHVLDIVLRTGLVASMTSMAAMTSMAVGSMTAMAFVMPMAAAAAATSVLVASMAAVAAVAAVASMAVSVTTVGDSVAVAMARVSVTFGVANAMACARLASV